MALIPRNLPPRPPQHEKQARRAYVASDLVLTLPEPKPSVRTPQRIPGAMTGVDAARMGLRYPAGYRFADGSVADRSLP